MLILCIFAKRWLFFVNFVDHLHLLLLAVKPLYIIAVKSCSFACKFIFAPFIFVIFKFHKHYSNFSSLPSDLKSP